MSMPANDARAAATSFARHADGARRALAAVVGERRRHRRSPRARIIREIRSRHAGERIVVFSQFADSVHEMFARLRRTDGVAAVTANGAIGRGRSAHARAGPRPVRAGGVVRSRAPSRAEAVEVLHRDGSLERRAQPAGRIGRRPPGPAVDGRAPNAATGPRLAYRFAARAGARVRDRAAGAGGARCSASRSCLTRKAGAAWSAIGEPFAPLLASGRP